MQYASQKHFAYTTTEKVNNKLRTAGTDIDLRHWACQAWWIYGQVPRFNLWASKSPLRNPYWASQHCVWAHQNLSAGNFFFLISNRTSDRDAETEKMAQWEVRWEKQPLCISVFWKPNFRRQENWKEKKKKGNSVEKTTDRMKENTHSQLDGRCLLRLHNWASKQN